MSESPRLPWRAVALATVLALIAATATYVALVDRVGDGSDADEGPVGTIQLTPEAEDEGAAGDEATFLTFEGQEIPLSELDGTPTLVNFFSSTCTPCITEMPALEEVYQELGGDQLAFVGLAVADRADDAMALVEDTGVTYPTAQDPDNAVFTELGGSVLPTTVLLDAEGEIVATHHGELDADQLRGLIADELGIAP